MKLVLTYFECFGQMPTQSHFAVAAMDAGFTEQQGFEWYAKLKDTSVVTIDLGQYITTKEANLIKNTFNKLGLSIGTRLTM